MVMDDTFGVRVVMRGFTREHTDTLGDGCSYRM